MEMEFLKAGGEMYFLRFTFSYDLERLYVVGSCTCRVSVRWNFLALDD